MSNASRSAQMEAKREEFRKYLEKEGVLEYLNKSLVSLYEADQPSNALDYLKNNCADKEQELLQLKLNNLTKEKDDLQTQNKELKEKVESLEKDNSDLRQKLSKMESKETEEPVEHLEASASGNLREQQQPPPEPMDASNSFAPEGVDAEKSPVAEVNSPSGTSVPDAEPSTSGVGTVAATVKAPEPAATSPGGAAASDVK